MSELPSSALNMQGLMESLLICGCALYSWGPLPSKVSPTLPVTVYWSRWPEWIFLVTFAVTGSWGSWSLASPATLGVCSLLGIDYEDALLYLGSWSDTAFWDLNRKCSCFPARCGSYVGCCWNGACSSGIKCSLKALGSNVQWSPIPDRVAPWMKNENN